MQACQDQKENQDLEKEREGARSASPEVVVRIKRRKSSTEPVRVTVAMGNTPDGERDESKGGALVGGLGTAGGIAEKSEESDCGAKCCGCFKGLLGLICIL